MLLKLSTKQRGETIIDGLRMNQFYLFLRHWINEIELSKGTKYLGSHKDRYLRKALLLD